MKLKQYSFKDIANVGGNVGNAGQYNWLLNHLAELLRLEYGRLSYLNAFKSLKLFVQIYLEIDFVNTIHLLVP